MREYGVVEGLEDQVKKKIEWYERVERHYPEGE